MAEWKTIHIGELGTVITGKTPKTACKENYGGEIPFLTPSDDLTTKFVPITKKTLSNLGLAEVKKCLLPANSICVSCIGSDLGKVVKTICPVVTNQQFNSIIPNDDYDADFVYYLMCIVGQELNYLSKTSTAVPIINKSQFEKHQIKVPPLLEQKRIAGILGALDDKIELNRRINANLEAQAVALYKQWFVDGRQEDWEYMMLGDVASVTAGGDRPTICSKIETEETRVPIYSNGIDNEGLYGYTNVAIVNEPSVTISARGTIGYVCLRQKPYTPIVRLISAIPKREYISAVYLYLWAKNMNIMGTGTTQQQLTVPDFKKQKVLIPDSATMQLFNDTVEPVFALINAYKQANNVIAYTRDTLLPKLMNNTLKQCQHENVL